MGGSISFLAELFANATGLMRESPVVAALSLGALLTGLWFVATGQYAKSRAARLNELKTKDRAIARASLQPTRWAMFLAGVLAIWIGPLIFIGNQLQPPMQVVELRSLEEGQSILDGIPPDFDFLVRGLKLKVGEVDSLAVKGPGAGDIYRISVGKLDRSAVDGRAAIFGRVCLSGVIEEVGFDYASTPILFERGAIIGPIDRGFPTGNHEFFVVIEDESVAEETLTIAIVRRRRASGPTFRGMVIESGGGGCPRP